MSETVLVSKDDILDLIACAEDYGHDNFVAMNSLVSWHGPISEEEIRIFANSYLEEEGYYDEDVETISSSINEAFKRYGKVVNA